MAVISLMVIAALARTVTAEDGSTIPATDPDSGLVIAEHWELVKAHCGACHSHHLVTANRGDADHWLGLIRWMQAKHNLWDLGPAQQPIIDYLSNHYAAPDNPPRRQPLNTTWRDGPILSEPEGESPP